MAGRAEQRLARDIEQLLAALQQVTGQMQAAAAKVVRLEGLEEQEHDRRKGRVDAGGGPAVHAD